MPSYFDNQTFANLVRRQRGSRSLREIASITGISASTISRVEKEQTPDLDTFFTLCNWLHIPPDKFIKNTEHQKEGETFRSICTKLRSDKRLNRDIAEALAVLIEAAYLKQI